MKKLAVVFLTLMTASCGVLPPYKPVSVKELLPVGSTIRLTRPIDIPADKSYVYIANGRVMPFKAINTVDVYKPYCEFKLARNLTGPRQVAPGTFTVTRIVEWENYYGRLGNTRLARADIAEVNINTGIQIRIGAGLFDDDGGPSLIMYATILSLQSSTHPEVGELVCGHWEEAGIVEPLTLEQLRSAFGDLLVIE